MFLSFNSRVAEIVGCTAAVVFENIAFWVLRNELNNRNFKDGKYWTYNSCRSFSEHFTCFSQKQIFNALNKLIEANLIVAENYNAIQSDRTKWYTIGEAGIQFYEESYKARKSILSSNCFTDSAFSQDGNSILPNENPIFQNGKMASTLYTDKRTTDTEPSLKETRKKDDPQPSFFDSDSEISEPVEKEEQIQKPVEQPKNLKPISIPPMPLPWDDEYQKKSEEDPNFEENWTKQWGKYCPIGKADPKTNKTVLLDEETGATYEENMTPLNEIAISLSRKNQGEPQQGQFVSTDPNTPITFEEFWAVYDLKTDKIKCRKLFDKLTSNDRIAIHQNLQAYIDSTPDKQYRKKPHRWLENRCWEDEIVLHDRFGRQTRDYTGL